MVRHSPSSQSTRPTWPLAPSSSSPPVVDEIVNHSTTANLHGAIGEHRRTSRSSSVSSGGSSTNSADGLNGLDVGRQQSHSRLALAQQNHVVQDASLLSLNGSQDKKDSTEAKQPLSASDDSGHFNLFMGSQSSGHLQQDIQNFPDLASRQGRPIIGPNNSSSTFTPSVTEPDMSRLFTDPFSSNLLSPSVQQDLNHLGLPNFFDSLTPSANDVGSIGTLSPYVPALSYQILSEGNSLFNSTGLFSGSQNMSNKASGSSMFQSQPTQSAFGLSGGQSNYNSAPVQYGSNSNLSNFNSASAQSTYGLSNSGVNGSYGNSTGYFSSNRQGNDYYGPSGSNYQAYGSQDFSLPPPPTQPWHGNAGTMPESMAKHIICEGCNKQKKWPHTLDCLHSFCFPCIASRFSPTDKTITCPKCPRKTVARDGPCNILLDYQGARYMREKLKVFPFGCTGCTRDQEAVTCCTTCMAFLCAECKEGHKTIHHFQGHSLTPITKIGKCADGDYKPLCEKHMTEPLSKYCCTCELMMCERCVGDHHHSETANNSHDIQEIYYIVVERLKTWNEDASIKHKDVVEITKKVPVLLQAMDNKRRGLRKQIEDYSDYCKTVVDQNRIAALEMLDKTHNAMETHVTSWAKIISSIERELEAVSSFNSRTLEGGSKLDLLKLLPTMENEYKRCVAGYAETIKDTDGIKVDIKFDPNYKESHTVLNQNFMSISYMVNDIEQKVSPTPGTQRNDFTRTRPIADYAASGAAENSDCNYQRWSAAPDSMSISTWNNVSERDRKNGTFIPHLNRCRTKTSYIHMFGEYGRSEYAFTEPSGQAYLKDGSYVICDTNNHRIVYYNNKHEFVRTIGQPPNLPPVAEDSENRSNGMRNKGFTRQEGYLYFPNRVAICPITQNIIATERPPSHDIQIFTIEGEFVRCFGGNILQHPRGVTVDEEGIIIVVECKVMKLVMFNQDGNFIVSHSLTKDLEFPNDVAAKDGKIFISDNRGHCVQVFDYDARFLYKIGNESITYFPIGVSINYLNQVVVTDNHNTFNITVFDIQGQVVNIFESVSKLAQCHNVAVHPNSLELMLTTKDCSVYFFNYDPNVTHPLTPPTSRPGHVLNPRRGGRGNGSGGSTGSTYY
uniref:RING-type domain-containing protein n=1 Tax=Biomphalaria glabrata TaxID=6526 RepID=A0A2C9JIV1_BIOGL